MIRGVGIDLMDMRRISANIPEDDAFILKTFTKAERAELASWHDRHEYICSRFSVKEAVFKALGRDGDDFSMTDIEVLTDGLGRPTAKLREKSAQLAQEAGIESIHVSISYDGNLVTALAVAEGHANS